MNSDDPTTPRPKSADPLVELARRLAAEPRSGARFEIVEEVGRGGMGTVFGVRDPILRRRLAMKVATGSGDPNAPLPAGKLSRFIAEAQITGQLDHPGIVPVHDLGVDAEGRTYFTMKLVEGETFKSVIDAVHARRDGWNLTRALGVLLRVCDAMAFAHEKGVIHRDLKPANIMVGRFGEVYVVDWGLARVLGAPDPVADDVTTVRREVRDGNGLLSLLTLDGEVVGTPAYMSPEQAEGDLGGLSPRSDIYALGAILHHLLAGKAPFGGSDSPRTPDRHRPPETGPRSLSSVVPRLPEELVAITERAMAPAPEARYPDMTAFAEDLRAYLEQRVVKAHATGTIAETSKWIRRNRGLAAVLLLLIATLATALVVTNELRVDAATSATTAKENETRAKTNEALARDAEARAETINASLFSLSALSDIDGLALRAEKLWPIGPDLVPALEAWVKDARALVDGTPAEAGAASRPSAAVHRARLADLRKRAAPIDPESLLKQRKAQTAWLDYKATAEELLWRERMLGLAPWPTPAEVDADIAAMKIPADPERLDALAWRFVDIDLERSMFGKEAVGWALSARAVAAEPIEAHPKRLVTSAWAAYRTARFDEAVAIARRADALLASTADHVPLVPKMESSVRRFTSTDGRAQRLKEVDFLVEEVARLERLLDEKRVWEFASTEDRWWHDNLSALVAKLDLLTDPYRGGLLTDGVSPTTGWGILKRLAASRALVELERTDAPAVAAWAAAREAIARSTRYGGLHLNTQTGLVPIGENPKTGLWEFEHVPTRGGKRAVAFDADGQVVPTDDMGIVFILVPGGSFTMGDPRADATPTHDVTLDPYFLAKFELTQSQWTRISARNPSFGRGGDAAGVRPVDGTTWLEVYNAAYRFGLLLPTESQWEYACRAGTTGLWSSGPNAASLRGSANLRPELGFDEFPGSSPVGAFDANPWGFHDLHGNVAEWCRDFIDRYPGNPRPGDGFRTPVATGTLLRSIRGGGWRSNATEAASPFRGGDDAGNRSTDVGVRFSRAVAP